jgi:hypothetical protein
VNKFLIKLSVILSGLAVVAMPLQAGALDRLGVTLTNGDFYLKEGTVNSAWHQETSGVNIGNYSLSGDRISLLDQGNTQKFVNIKEPGWNSQWNATYFSDGSQPFASKQLVSKLSDGQYRLLVLRDDGSVVMKDGPWNTGWWSGTVEPSNVADIAIGGDRIGVVMNTGEFKVKQLTPGKFSHPNNTSWDVEATDASANKVAISSTRIAYIDANNNAYVKEGATNSQWFGNKTVIHSLSNRIRLAGNRSCSLGMGIRAGVVECKEGALDSLPVQVYSSDASDVKVSTSRVGVVTTGNNAYVLEGSLHGANSGWQMLGLGNIASIETN